MTRDNYTVIIKIKHFVCVSALKKVKIIKTKN